MPTKGNKGLVTVMVFGGGQRLQPSSGGGGGSYTGPLDLVPGAVVAYSTERALSADYLGGDNFTLERDSDSGTMVAANNATTGIIDDSAISSWAGAAFITFNELNDQSGNGKDMTVPGGIKPEWFSDSGISCLRNINDNAGRLQNNAVNISGGAIKIVLVAAVTVVDSALLLNITDTNVSNGAQIDIETFYNTGGDIAVIMFSADGMTETDWATTETLDANTLYLIVVSIDAAGNVTVTANGADMGATIQSGSAIPYPGASPSTVQFPRGSDDIVRANEAYVWPGSADISSAVTNIATYYGITLS